MLCKLTAWRDFVVQCRSWIALWTIVLLYRRTKKEAKQNSIVLKISRRGSREDQQGHTKRKKNSNYLCSSLRRPVVFIGIERRGWGGGGSDGRTAAPLAQEPERDDSD
ncbi:hypothetical protein GWI33_018942 [Rhynchophorus ferrugineus]|uniref:Uncharacterized protein n=1 Tax=Rhynchophorus ferrugineus TaxID=354439 RepID=A0A834HSK9_RHYFE|nr:hypothetical protein GWI33_018942 [Rhynchophorus ferrugineus]